MTTAAATDISTIEPITHREAHGLAEDQYSRFVDLLDAVGPEDWSKPTDCEGWTVRDLAGHMLGAMRSAASVRELVRQQRLIKQRVKEDGGNEVDHMTAVQVELTAGLTPTELVDECRSLVGPAARGRKRTPAPMRRLVRLPVEIGSISEKWTLGYLLDVILTRDTFLHRVDLARALDHALDLDDRDRRIAADIVAEWARRHGEAFELRLGGPAGGHYVSPRPSDDPPIEIDAIEFCRVLSGRATRAGLLEQEVPF